MAKLTTIEGVGEKYAEKLKNAGVTTTDKLLEMGETPKGRKDIAEKSGISGKLILTWVNHVDLFRINGVRGQYAELLEDAGVDTVKDLARRNAVNLTKKMEEVNEAGGKKIVQKVPVLSQVEKWIAEAKELPRKVQY